MRQVAILVSAGCIVLGLPTPGATASRPDPAPQASASDLQPPRVAAARTSPPLRVATYNVCKTSCGTGPFAWNRRKDALVRTIRSARPDVLALQEADNSYSWLASVLSKYGYARVVPLTDDCTDQACIDDSQLFYRTARITPLVTPVPNEPVSAPCRAFIDDTGQLLVPPPIPDLPAQPRRTDFPDQQSYLAAQQSWTSLYGPQYAAYQEQRRAYEEQMDQYWIVDRQYNCDRFIGRSPFRDLGSGLVSLAGIGSARWAAGVDNRNFAWAVLGDRRTGGSVVAVSMHLPNEKTDRAERYRTNLARAIVSYLRTMQRTYGLRRSPVVMMGDLNSFAARQPRGAQWVLGRAGFRDAYAATKRVNADVSTANITPDRNPWPAAPRRLDEPARIDYIFHSTGKALRYEVHLRLQGRAFDNRYRGSDHNLVLADLRLPRVPAGARWQRAQNP